MASGWASDAPPADVIVATCQETAEWVFKPLRVDACKIDFELHYEFSSKILEQIIGPVFNMIANNFVDSFCKRAETIYG